MIVSVRPTAIVFCCLSVVLHAAFCRAQGFPDPSAGFGDGESAEAPEPQLLNLFEQESIRSELQLNNEQQSKVETILGKHRADEQQLKQSYDDKLKSITSIGERLRKRAEFNGEIRKATEQARTQAETQLMELLNPQQQAALNERIRELKINPPATNRSDDAPDSTSQTPDAPARGSSPSPDDGKPAAASFGAASMAEGDEAAEDRPVADGTPQATRLTFNFHKAPWSEVLQLFADAAGLSLNLRDAPPGTFSYLDRQEYTPTEALDIMNRYLLQEGFLLVRHDRFLTVVNASKGIPPNLIETVTPDELENRGGTELVRVALPLGDRDTNKAATEIRALLGPQGQVAPLESANSVVVTDVAENLVRVKKLLEPPPKVGATETTFQAYPLINIDAPSAAEILRSLLGLDAGVRNVSGGQSDDSNRRSRRGGFDPRNFRRGFGRGDDDGGDDGQSRDGGSDSTPATTSKAKVTYDLRTNSVLVTASASEMKLVDEIIKSIDVVPTSTSSIDGSIASIEPYLEVYQLQTADAQEVAKTLGVLHPGMVVNEDGGNKRIHIWATREKHREIEAHVRQLDGAAGGEMLAVLPLNDLNAYDVTTTLTSLYAGNTTAAPTFQFDPSGTGLIVNGNLSQISQIRSLVEQLGAQGMSSSQRTVRVVPVSSSSSPFVREAIGAMYPQISVSTTAATTSQPNGNSRSNEQNEDNDRSDRMRRFRERFFGGSDGSSGGGRSFRSFGGGGRRGSGRDR